MLGIVILSASQLCGQSSGRNLHFDLSRIGFALDGRQICEDKRRLQDYSSKVMDQIIAAGPKSVPVLIGMITMADSVEQIQDPDLLGYEGKMFQA